MLDIQDIFTKEEVHHGHLRFSLKRGSWAIPFHFLTALVFMDGSLWWRGDFDGQSDFQ